MIDRDFGQSTAQNQAALDQPYYDLEEPITEEPRREYIRQALQSLESTGTGPLQTTSTLNGLNDNHHNLRFKQNGHLQEMTSPPSSLWTPNREFPVDWWAHSLEQARVYDFFHTVSGEETHPDIMIMMVTQAVHGREETFIRNVDRVFPIGALVSKPNNSDHEETTNWRKKGYNVLELTRNETGNSEVVIPHIEEALARTGARAFIIFDIGGYHVGSNSAVREYFGDAFIMSIEDTWNGELAAQRAGIDYPFSSIARDFNKARFEDYRVGDRIALNALMLHYDIPEVTDVDIEGTTMSFQKLPEINNVLTLGLGNVGNGAADTANHIFPYLEVVDINPKVHEEGSNRGITMLDLEEALEARQKADLVISCTGNGGMDFFSDLLPGAEFALATGADDEIGERGLQILHDQYHAVPINRNTTLYISKADPIGNYFYGLNSERAANFAMNKNGNGGKYSADIGPYILPSQAVMLRLAVSAAREWKRGNKLSAGHDGIIRPTPEDSAFVTSAFLQRWPECTIPY